MSGGDLKGDVLHKITESLVLSRCFQAAAYLHKHAHLALKMDVGCNKTPVALSYLEAGKTADDHVLAEGGNLGSNRVLEKYSGGCGRLE